jgi:hypothetical protein
VKWARELELELILSHMTQKPMLRGEVGAVERMLHWLLLPPLHELTPQRSAGFNTRTTTVGFVCRYSHRYELAPSAHSLDGTMIVPGNACLILPS